MADPNMNKTTNNDPMQREQSRSQQSNPGATGDRKPEHKSDEDRREQGRLDKEGREKSAIGGGEKGTTGQAGQSPTGQSGQNREFDKSRSEPTSR